jgi:hypothetical protein
MRAILVQLVQSLHHINCQYHWMKMEQMMMHGGGRGGSANGGERMMMGPSGTMMGK